MNPKTQTKLFIAISTTVIALSTSPVFAIGCLSGGAAGAVAGHVAGHHAVVGAVGGCMVGHHLAVKKKQEEQANKLIADYATSPEGSPQQAKDAAGIQKLAQKKVPIAVKWEQEHSNITH
jgi:hypothetical protein